MVEVKAPLLLKLSEKHIGSSMLWLLTDGSIKG